jgi:hypothetical protein
MNALQQTQTSTTLQQITTQCCYKTHTKIPQLHRHIKSEICRKWRREQFGIRVNKGQMGFLTLNPTPLAHCKGDRANQE